MIGPQARCEGVEVVRAVAVAACRSAGGRELYPDADWPALRDALAGRGVEIVRVAWDDPGVGWGRFDLVVVRSTWDSVDRPSEYLSWTRAVDAATRLPSSISPRP